MAFTFLTPLPFPAALSTTSVRWTKRQDAASATGSGSEFILRLRRGYRIPRTITVSLTLLFIVRCCASPRTSQSAECEENYGLKAHIALVCQSPDADVTSPANEGHMGLLLPPHLTLSVSVAAHSRFVSRRRRNDVIDELFTLRPRPRPWEHTSVCHLPGDAGGPTSQQRGWFH